MRKSKWKMWFEKSPATFMLFMKSGKAGGKNLKNWKIIYSSRFKRAEHSPDLVVQTSLLALTFMGFPEFLLLQPEIKNNAEIMTRILKCNISISSAF